MTIYQTISLPKSIKWVSEETNSWHHFRCLALTLQNETLLVSVIGSFKNSKGASSWRTCNTTDGKICWKGSIHCPGTSEYNNSTRIETLGVYRITRRIKMVHLGYPAITGSFTTCCSSESTMHKWFPLTLVNSTSTHYNLAHSIRFLMI